MKPSTVYPLLPELVGPLPVSVYINNTLHEVVLRALPSPGGETIEDVHLDIPDPLLLLFKLGLIKLQPIGDRVAGKPEKRGHPHRSVYVDRPQVLPCSGPGCENRVPVKGAGRLPRYCKDCKKQARTKDGFGVPTPPAPRSRVLHVPEGQQSSTSLKFDGGALLPESKFLRRIEEKNEERAARSGGKV